MNKEKLNKRKQELLKKLELTNNSLNKLSDATFAGEEYYAITLSSIDNIDTFTNNCDDTNMNHISNGNYFSIDNKEYANKLSKKIKAELIIRKWLEINDCNYHDIFNSYIKGEFYFSFNSGGVALKQISIDEPYFRGTILFSHKAIDAIHQNIRYLKPFILDYLMVS